MTSQSQVFARSSALAVLVIVLACQHESSTDFDDTNLPDASGGTASGGSKPNGGESLGAGPSTGGTEPDGNGGSAAGAGENDTGGSPTAGSSTGGAAGKAGSASGGAAGNGGTSEGGKAGAGVAGGGTGGKPPDPEPEPVTITITDIDDAHIASCAAYMSYGDAEKLMVDGSIACSYAALVDPALEKIPAGAQISTATLKLSCVNAGGAISVSYVDETWTENNVRWTMRPAAGDKLGSVTCEQTGPVEIDLTVAVKAWLAGEHHAYGVYLQTTAQDGTDFVSAEGDDAAARPALVVTYLPPKK